MKQVLVTMCLLSMWVTGAAAQATSSTNVVPTPVSMTAETCGGDILNVFGSMTTEVTTTTDSAGTVHVRTSVTSSDLTAVSSEGDEYAVKFATRMIDNSGDDSADVLTFTYRLKLTGPGPLGNDIMFMLFHITNPPQNTGVNVDRVWCNQN